MTDWDVLDLIVRGMPDAGTMAKVVKKIRKMPGAGDQQHVQALFPVYGKSMPVTPDGVWDDAALKTVKFRKLQASNAQLDRKNLIWHVQNPGKSKMRSPRNTHPQLIKLKTGGYLIADGHHRLSALSLLGLKKEQCWVVKEKDL